MTSWMDFAMLICAVVGSVTFSLWLAFGILRVGFVLIRPRRRTTVKAQQAEAARLS